MAGLWVMSGPGLPCGARQLGAAGDGRVWLDVCILGQHLPQMYPPGEIRDLEQDGCARLGLCEDCYGFGDLDRSPVTDMLTAARGIDEITQPCPGCGGTGRPAIRATLAREPGSVQGTLVPLPHAYVPPVQVDRTVMAAFGVSEDWCMACGMPEAGTAVPEDAVLHVSGATR